MLFNSFEFLFVFLPVTFFVYFYLTSKRLIVGSKVWLVAASLLFYSWWKLIYLPLILGSMLLNFAIGSELARTFHLPDTNRTNISRKKILIFGILINVLVLGYFKYTDFMIANLNEVFSTDFPLLEIMLPLAISFFTFQQIAYLVDSYRGATHEYDLLNYMLFVTFFPQLIAGPIVHHSEMMPEFAQKRNFIKNYRNILLGLFIFSMGLFKKVALADYFAAFADSGFSTTSPLDFYLAWKTSLSYTFQIYFDFSGYVDMAIGIGLFFNINLPINFDSPYKATNIQDFWRRWHITLSRWLKDYIYVPLGGNRHGHYRTYFNLFATFLIGGIWHGASWMFVIWGCLHGLALVIHRLWLTQGFKMNQVLAWFITFNFVNLTWVFFRADSMNDAKRVLAGMFGFSESLTNILDVPTSQIAKYGILLDSLIQLVPLGIAVNAFELVAIVIAFVLVLVPRSSTYYYLARKENNYTYLMTLVLLVGALLVMSYSTSTVFLYFNF